MIAENLNRFKKFRTFIGPDVWRFFIFSIFLGVFLFFVEASFVYIIQGFFLTIGLIRPDQANLPDWYPSTSFASILILLLFGICRGIMYMGKQYLGGVVSQTFLETKRSKMVEISLTRAEEVDAADIINLFSDRIPHAGFVLQAFSQATLLLMSISFLFLLGMTIAPNEMIVSILLSAVLMAPLSFFNAYIKKTGKQTREDQDQAVRILHLGLKHNFFLKIYDLVDENISNGVNALRSYRSNYQKYFLVSSVRSFLPGVIGIIVLCFVTVYFIKNPTGKDAIKFISFFYLFMRLAQSVSDLNTQITEIRMNFGAFLQSYHWFQKFENTKPELNVNVSKNEELMDVIRIEGKGVSFGYTQNQKLFSDLNFDLYKGDILLIKGKSGTGKSTLLKVITGLDCPTEGQVYINNINSFDVGKSFRRYIGYVGPEPYIIHGTIRENLLYGQKEQNINDARLKEVLKLVHLTDEVPNLDFSINELTGLSTGQKQRLSLARALLRKPKVLILDEATANLDLMTENRIICDLKIVSKDLITIIVSHKPTFDEMASFRINL